MKRSFLSRVRDGLSISLLALVAACGGGGGGGGSQISAPANLSYSTPQVFVLSQPITTMSPTVTGTVSSYSVTPALPAGLSLNSSTGVISGTPTAVSSGATYVVTASNSAGSTSANVTLSVNDAAPVISYPKTSYNFTTGVAPAVSPANTGGPALSWSINPALPEGLIFSSTSGAIGGTPVSPSNPTTYVVTAQNSGGTDSFELTISVDAGVVFDLGHSGPIQVLDYDGDRVLSQDGDGHWVLWDAQTREQVAQGNVGCELCQPSVELAGSTFIVKTQLRSATDGSLLANLTVPGASCWSKLATDGSYVAFGCDNGLYLWTRNGTALLTRTGAYHLAKAFAAPNELRMSNTPAGTNIIEKISIPNGTVSTSVQYLGQFRSWFADGDRFLTVDSSNTVRVFSSNGGAPEDTRVLATVDGLDALGDWFWVTRYPGFLDIYSVGASASPAVTYDFTSPYTLATIASATTIGVLTTTGTSVIDLSGASPSKVDFASELAPSHYAAISATEWVIGSSQGVVADLATTPAAPRYFGFGNAWDVVAGEQFFAVATASGRIVYFDSTTLEQEGIVDFFATDLQLSADGTVLAAGLMVDDPRAAFRTDRSLKIFSLPSGNLVRSWPATAADAQQPADFTLSASGTVIGRVLRTSGPIFTREVSLVSGGAPTWSDTLNDEAPIRLSPSGNVIAVADSSAGPDSITSIISNTDGSLLGQGQGWAGNFIDENRLLLARFDMFLGQPRQRASALFNAAGQQLDTLDFYDMEFQPVDANRIYSRGRIFNLSSKQFDWVSEVPVFAIGLRSDVTSTHAIYQVGATVRAEVY